VRILEASDDPRPKARTVEIGYVHSAEEMRLRRPRAVLVVRACAGERSN